MGFFNYILSKLRNIQYSITGGNRRALLFGCVYKMSYRNWKHDPNPLIWVQYSDQKYTHGININYLSPDEKMWLMRTIYNVKKGAQRIDGRVFYQLMKFQKPSIAKKAYRLYHTNMIMNFKLVSAGITNNDPLVSPFGDPWVLQLNKFISPQRLDESKNIKVAYSQDELQNRIAEAVNAIPITKKPTFGVQQKPNNGRPF